MGAEAGCSVVVVVVVAVEALRRSGAVEVTCAVPVGLESGAGELSCARETDIALSNAAAPQTNWLRRVDIGLMEICGCKSF